MCLPIITAWSPVTPRDYYGQLISRCVVTPTTGAIINTCTGTCKTINSSAVTLISAQHSSAQHTQGTCMCSVELWFGVYCKAFTAKHCLIQVTYYLLAGTEQLCDDAFLSTSEQQLIQCIYQVTVALFDLVGHSIGGQSNRLNCVFVFQSFWFQFLHR